MRKNAFAVLALVLILAAPALAAAHGWGHGPRGHWHGHRHGYVGPRVWVGAPVWAWRPYGYYGGYGPWGPGPVVVRERTIVREQPVYVEREPAAPDGTWYFCRSEDAYYPDVERCPEPWVPVPARGQ